MIWNNKNTERLFLMLFVIHCSDWLSASFNRKLATSYFWLSGWSCQRVFLYLTFTLRDVQYLSVHDCVCVCVCVCACVCVCVCIGFVSALSFSLSELQILWPDMCHKQQRTANRGSSRCGFLLTAGVGPNVMQVTFAPWEQNNFARLQSEFNFRPHPKLDQH